MPRHYRMWDGTTQSERVILFTEEEEEARDQEEKEAKADQAELAIKDAALSVAKTDLKSDTATLADVLTFLKLSI